MYLAVFDDGTALFGILRGKSGEVEVRRARLANDQMIALWHALPIRESIEGPELTVPFRQIPCDAADARSMEIHAVMYRTVIVLQGGTCAPEAGLQPLHDELALVMTALASR